MIQESGPRLVAILLVGLVALVVGCGPSAYDELRAIETHLPERWIRALVAESPADFDELVDAHSADYLLLVETELNDALDTSSLEAFNESIRVLLGPLTRTRRALRDRFGFERSWKIHEQFFSLPREEGFRAHREWRRLVDLARDNSLTFESRARELRRSLTRADSIGQPARTALLWQWTFERFDWAGDDDAALKTLHRAIRRAEEEGDHWIRTQALGSLGSYHRGQDDYDRMNQCWQEALQVAIEHRLAVKSGRILEFYSGYYERRGQLDLARNLLYEAERQSASLGGSPNDVRFLEQYLQFNADLGCWDAVEQALPRAPLLLEQVALWTRDPINHAKWRAEIEWAEGRLRVSQREFGEASRLFSSALDRSARARQSELGFKIRMDWAQSSLEEGRPEKAMELLEPCLASTDAVRTLAPTLLLMARAEARRERWDACGARLSEFEGLDLRHFESNFPEAVGARVLAARAELARGQRVRAIEIVAATCDSVETRLTEWEASQQAFLQLRDLEPLHQLLHELVEGRAASALALELAWRKIPSLLDQGAGYDRARSPLQQCKQIVRGAHAGGAVEAQLTFVPESALPVEGPLEVAYLVDADSLERWTRVGEHLAHEVVAIDPHEFRARIGDVLTELGRGAAEEATSSRELASELRSLARLLLPQPVLDAVASPGGYREIRLQPGTVLSGFPFGVLNLSDDGYRPLVSSFNPIFERGVAGTREAGPTTDPGLIVADPAVSPGLAAWTSGLPPLPHGVREARALREWNPETVLLEGSAATKAALRRHWNRAGLIYFASHVVQDPSSPYLSFIPLAQQEVQQGQAVVRGNELLDIQDVRSARLHGQPLVVLSACSSGAPYQSGGALAPSLGDAFIDAGASAVIHTLWSVRDDAAADLMQKTMRAWSVDGVEPARALADARREMAAGGRFAHPYFWGSTVVQVRGR